VDETHVFIAPKVIGGADAKSPVARVGVDRIQAAALWEMESVENLDGDAYLRYLRIC